MVIKRKRKTAGVNFKQLFTHGVEIECDDLVSFVHTMESAIKSEETRFSSFMDRLTNDLDESRKAEVVDHYVDDIIGVMETYPRLLWQSVFISLYSYFEQEMNGICRRVRRIADTKNFPRTKAPKSAAVILPGHKCLLEFKIRLAVKSSEWKRMTTLVGVRNLIVHNRGQLRPKEDESKRVKQYARRAKHITIDRSNTIVITGDFCLDMIETMRLVLRRTIASIPQRLFQG